MAVNVVAWADPVRRSEPARLRSWYLACPSEALRPGQVMGWSLGGRELVLFRGQSGRVQALSAHCAHMGAHLTSYTLQRTFHHTHHRHNRTELEQFDYLRPGDNRFLKHAQWYSILTGLYGAFVPAGCLAFALFPSLLQRLRGTGTRYGEQTGADAYLARLEATSAVLSPRLPPRARRRSRSPC